VTTQSAIFGRQPAGASLRARIEGGETVRGLLTEIGDPTLIELCGHAGLDFACLDLEHGSISDRSAEGALRAAETAHIHLLARVRIEDLVRAARFLDAGGTGVILAHISNREQAEFAARSLLLPPAGVRGVGATRTSRLGFDSTDLAWAAKQERDLVLGMQIEDAEGVRNTADIAGHSAVSLILVGTRDLSFDLGVPGRYEDPLVTSALEAIRAGCAGRAALGLMVRDLVSEQPIGAKVLFLGLGALMRFAANRFRQVT
jgi:4-hydroxy-2-oxoheptanedioate aldolase